MLFYVLYNENIWLFRKTVSVIILTLVTGSGILCELISTIVALVTNGDVIINNCLLNGMFRIFGETQLQSDAIRVVILSVIYIAASLAANMLSIKRVMWYEILMFG